jgi:Rad3-related DNA helicase
MWSLYKGEKYLEPLVFSNGKTQEDIVKEVLDLVKKGNKIIFIKGMCGTGKSAIALNIARKIGKTSIVVPGKELQNQYKKDYEADKYLLKDNKEKLKISVITGRNNHECKFLKDNKDSIPKVFNETNSKLNDIFEGKREKIKETISGDLSADNPNIPCKIEILEKNWKKIYEYLKQNKKIKIQDIESIKDVRRIPLASVCPYWSPAIPENYEVKIFENAKKRKYAGLKGTNFVFYQRNPGCKFYEQFNSFIDSDVIVFNALKYKLESAINRKPLTEVEIIDECDEFLDSFSNQRNINLDRLQNSLTKVLYFDEETENILKEIGELISNVKRNSKVLDSINSREIIPLKATGIYDLIKIFIKSPNFFSEVDEESYIFDVDETARMFEDFIEETYVTFHKKDNSLVASLVTTNLEKKFKEMAEKNKVLILMSGTLHSEKILKEVFGLPEFKIIEAETQQPGKIYIKKSGIEVNCKHENFKNGVVNRESYLLALDKCLDMAKRPTLVHIISYYDLPSEKEIEDFDLKNLTSREEIISEKNNKEVSNVAKFKKKEIDVLFSTRCARGIDFPGEECNSIIFTKYPNPDAQDAFWKTLYKTKPYQYWDFYKDKAKRELLQKVYRGLRFKEDKVEVLSPDIRVIEAFEEIEKLG